MQAATSIRYWRSLQPKGSLTSLCCWGCMPVDSIAAPLLGPVEINPKSWCTPTNRWQIFAHPSNQLLQPWTVCLPLVDSFEEMGFSLKLFVCKISENCLHFLTISKPLQRCQLIYGALFDAAPLDSQYRRTFSIVIKFCSYKPWHISNTDPSTSTQFNFLAHFKLSNSTDHHYNP